MNEQSICVLWFAIKQATYVSNGRYMVVFQHGTACTPAHQAPGRGAWDRSQPDLHSTVHWLHSLTLSLLCIKLFSSMQGAVARTSLALANNPLRLWCRFNCCTQFTRAAWLCSESLSKSRRHTILLIAWYGWVFSATTLPDLGWHISAVSRWTFAMCCCAFNI